MAYWPLSMPANTDIRTIVKLKAERTKKESRFIDRLTYISINYLFIYVRAIKTDGQWSV
jgi:hypothetical protein